jgi:hypothetical protein
MNYEQGKAITFNNFACYFRRIGKIRTAFQYLKKALDLEMSLDVSKNPADTHINI